MIVRVSTGGDQLRLEFANRNGAQPVLLGKVHAGLAHPGGSHVAGTDREVRFGGGQQIVLMPGARVVSVPVNLAVALLSHVAVSVYLPEHTPTE